MTLPLHQQTPKRFAVCTPALHPVSNNRHVHVCVSPNKGRPNIRDGGLQGQGCYLHCTPEHSTSAETASHHLSDVLSRRQMLPMVVFCFSKKRVDMLAANLGSLDMATGAEKAEVHRFCDRALARLHPDDRNLPQARPLSHPLIISLLHRHAPSCNTGCLLSETRTSLICHVTEWPCGPLHL